VSTCLHVNIDHVATLRQARGTRYPDPVWAASLCELAGAVGITVHLREDRRHIADRDVRILRDTVRTTLNLEMAATEEIIAIACELKPDIATLVPEKRAERTTEGGLDLRQPKAVARAVKRLQDTGIQVSLFIDPTRQAVLASHATGAKRIELHTGDYCAARGDEATRELQRLAVAAEEGVAAGLHVAAGHGLDYPNVGPVAAIPGVTELNIGHSIIARAVFVGLDRAVRDMLDAIRAGELGE
jgi:pyridoxine 5-phosphate synthase